jgi:hypothetical protein
MNSGISFGAPWGKLLKVTTACTVILMIGISCVGLMTGPRGGVDGMIWFVVMVASPLLVIVFSLPFAVRGYVLSRGTLLVKRMGWYSRIDLHGIRGVESDPKAMGGSIRTFGNGGLFGFTGMYWSRRFRIFRVFATDFRYAIVLHLQKGIVVITPDDPQAFVRDIRMLCGMSCEERRSNKS